MLLTNQDALNRLNSPKNLANRFRNPDNVTEIPLHRPGRKVNVPNLTVDVTNEIALRARLGEKQTSLAKEFDTTQARVSQLERGEGKALNEEMLEQQLDSAKHIAVEKLLSSLGCITQDKLANENARNLSRIASNLAQVIERTSPKAENDGTAVQVVIYAPELRKESSFKTIDI